MLKKSVTINNVLTVLNEALCADKEAIDNLVKARVQCNETLANHPTIQIGIRNNGYTVGLLGILNGLFGINDQSCGYIAAEYDEADKLVCFKRI